MIIKIIINYNQGREVRISWWSLTSDTVCGVLFSTYSDLPNKTQIIQNAYLHIKVTQWTSAHDLIKIRDPEGVITNFKDTTQKTVESEFALNSIILLVISVNSV